MNLHKIQLTDSVSTLHCDETDQSEKTLDFDEETGALCTLYGKTLKSAANLTKHMKRVHGTSDDGTGVTGVAKLL